MLQAYNPETETGEPFKSVLDMVADDDGVAVDRIPRRYRRQELRAASLETWYEFTDDRLVVEPYGLVAAIPLKRDYGYSPRGGTKNVPQAVMDWKPREEFIHADRKARLIARKKVSVIRPAVVGGLLVLVGYWIGEVFVAKPWVGAIAVPVMVAILRAGLNPILDGRWDWRFWGSPS